MPAQPLTIHEGWEKVSDDGHLIKKIIKEGTGYKKPEDGAKAEGWYSSIITISIRH